MAFVFPLRLFDVLEIHEVFYVVTEVEVHRASLTLKPFLTRESADEFVHERMVLAFPEEHTIKKCNKCKELFNERHSINQKKKNVGNESALEGKVDL